MQQSCTSALVTTKHINQCMVSFFIAGMPGDEATTVGIIHVTENFTCTVILVR